MNIIGIHGPLGSGKSTTASILSNLFAPYSVRILPFSDPVKRIASLMGWNGKKDKKGRKLLQFLGTECGRNLIKKDIWVKKWTYEIYEEPVDYLIADDIRFKNELAQIHKMHGLTLKIKGRSDYGEHESEKEIENKYFHFCVDNSGTKDELTMELQEIVDAAIKCNFKFPVS